MKYNKLDEIHWKAQTDYAESKAFWHMRSIESKRETKWVFFYFLIFSCILKSKH